MLLYCFAFHLKQFVLYHVFHPIRHPSTRTSINADCLEFFLATYCLARLFFSFPWHFLMIFDNWEKHIFRWLECCCLVSALVIHKTAKKNIRKRGRWKAVIHMIYFLCCLLKDRWDENILAFLAWCFFLLFDQGIHACIFESLYT